MVIAALTPIILFLSPLWRITLIAPQYPNGISMYIWIDKITGDDPGTIQNINILNHYVGMRPIEEDLFPELTYFPFVVAGIVVLGLLTAISKKPKLYFIWSLIFSMLAILGIYDFYLWEYDYGHNLSDSAPIKVPGQAYQPPLFGSKMLLNFNAISLPALGGISMGIAILLGYVAYFRTLKESKE